MYQGGQGSRLRIGEHLLLPLLTLDSVWFTIGTLHDRDRFWRDHATYDILTPPGGGIDDHAVALADSRVAREGHAGSQRRRLLWPRHHSTDHHGAGDVVISHPLVAAVGQSARYPEGSIAALDGPHDLIEILDAEEAFVDTGK